MSTLMRTVKEQMDQAGLNYSDEGDCSGDVATEPAMQIALTINEPDSLVILTSNIEESILEEKRMIMAEFIVRINENLDLGHFDICMDRGDVRFKISIPISDGVLPADSLPDMFNHLISIVNRYSPGFTSIYHEDVSIDEAFEIIEDISMEDPQ